MKLYLSSFRIGNKPGELLDLMGDNKRVAVINNARDFDTNEIRKTAVFEEMGRLESIGLICTDVDLRDYFGKTEELKTLLQQFDLIWVRGGNCFILRRAFNQSGLDTFIRQFIEEDKIVYGGYSAGIDMLVPSLRGAELVDDPNIIPATYNPEIIWECLNILPYTVAPHYKSDHPESAAVDKSIEYLIENHIPFIALRDGEAMVINDGTRYTEGSRADAPT